LLKVFQDRDLSGEKFVAVFVDGKTFAEDTMVIALGVTEGGEKRPLGFVQTSTKNERAVSEVSGFKVKLLVPRRWRE